MSTLMILGLLSCERTEKIEPAQGGELQIFYSGRMDGEIEPCG
jgi:hypothetical protein